MATTQENSQMLGAHRNEQTESTGQTLDAGTTQFNTDAIVQSSQAAKRVPGNSLLPIQNQTIPDFLKKPQVLTTFSWDTSQVQNVTLSTNGIGPSLGAFAPWADKFRGFENVRGTVCFRLTVNTNPFQQGKLIMSFLPVQSTSNPTLVLNTVARSPIWALTQLPNVELDCRDGVAVIHIPYVAPYDFYNLKTDLFDWGTVKINVLSPLRTGSGGSTSVNCTLFQWFEDFELATPLYPQSSTRKAAKTRVKKAAGPVEIEKHGMAVGPVSTALGLTSKVADLVGDTIPSLSSMATTVSWVSRALSGLASYFGWSKPDLDVAPQVIVHRNAPNMSNTDGVSAAPNLSLIHDNSIGSTDTMFGTDIDEMSFAFLKKHKGLYFADDWATTDVSGTVLYTSSVIPTNYFGSWQLTRGAKTLVMNTYVPFAFLARFFGYYRGSIKLHFKFVKTEFHTGRLLLTFTPSMSVTGAPTIANSTLALREIIDMRGCNEFEVTIPYLLPRKYSRVTESMGKVEVRVLNELECPETCSSTVDFLVYASAAEDFELQGPGGATSATPNPVFSPQMGDLVAPDHTSKVVEDIVGGQPRPINNLECASECFGESFSSIKQLINRYTPLRTNVKVVSASTGDSAGLITMHPYAFKVGTNDSSGTLIAPSLFDDALSIFSTGYAFFRGSVKISVYNKDVPNNVVLTYLKLNRDYTSTYLNLTDSLPTGFFSASSMTSTSGTNYGVSAYQLHNSHTGVVEVKVPYYATTHMTPVDAGSYTTSGPSYSTNPSIPDVSLSIQVPSSTSPYQLFRSASDEFQFGYFIGFAPTLAGYV